MQITITDQFDNERPIFIRLDGMSVSRTGEGSTAEFKGFVSQASADDNVSDAVWARTLEFDADLSRSLPDQAFAALQAALASDEADAGT